MTKLMKYVFGSLLMMALLYTISGYISASKNADELKQRADLLIASGKGINALSEDRLLLLFLVQDPSFLDHKGVDMKTAGAGLTTITQSLSKRLAFDEFKPGIGKLRQTAYALSLEQHLTKEEILALFLDTVHMGKGTDGWTIGFFKASQSFYGNKPNELSHDQYIELISVMIAPSHLNHISRNEKFTERLRRIDRLQKGDCKPRNNRDVWFEAC